VLTVRCVVETVSSKWQGKDARVAIKWISRLSSKQEKILLALSYPENKVENHVPA